MCVASSFPPPPMNRPTIRPARVHLVHVLLREQGREDDPPRVAAAMKLGGLEWVVVPEPLGQLVVPDQDSGSEEPANDRSPRVHHG